MTHSSGSWPSTSKASLFLSSRGRCSLTDTKKSFVLLAIRSTFTFFVLLATFQCQCLYSRILHPYKVVIHV